MRVCHGEIWISSKWHVKPDVGSAWMLQVRTARDICMEVVKEM